MLKSDLAPHSINIGGILKRLPHRFPFLLVDRVLQFERGTIVCAKNVTYNEPYFAGHFPVAPVMPGVLQLEAMAQAAALCHVETARLDDVDITDKLFLFTHVKNAKFSKPVIPGDVLIIRASLLKKGSILVGYQCDCAVDEKIVSEGEIYASIADADNFS